MTTTQRCQPSSNGTYKPFFHQQILGRENIDPPVQKGWLTRATKPMLRSTVVAFSIAMIPNVGVASTLPTNPLVARAAAQAQEKIASVVYQFDLCSTKSEIFNFLKDHHDATKLLEKWHSISNSIFKQGLRSKLEVVLDRETEKQLLTIAIHTGIEDEEVFFVAEEKVFNLIEAYHLERGLENVVLSLY